MIYTASSQYKEFGPYRLYLGEGWLSNLNDLNAWVGMEYPRPMEKIVIVNGFHELKDKSDWKWHARAATVRFNHGEFVLQDTLDPQIVVLPEKTTSVHMEIMSVYPSEKFNVVGLMMMRAE